MQSFMSIAEAWNETIKKEPTSTLPPNYPPTKPVIDWNGTLYSLSIKRLI